MIERQWTVQEVLDLQNEKKALEQRLEVHKRRAEEKQKELQAIFTKYNVASINDLLLLCKTTSENMQDYANKEYETILKMKEQCDELDRKL